jgi:hypothetical protein
MPQGTASLRRPARALSAWAIFPDIHRLLAAFAAIFLVFGLAGCAIQVAPAFDRTIVQGLTDANEEAMILFASVSSGSSANSFPARKPVYDSLIGRFDALRLLASSRPRPTPPSLFAKASTAITKVSEIDLLSEAPSIPAIAKIVELLTRMRDTDQSRGLTPVITELFKGDFEIEMQSALTYEKALER